MPFRERFPIYETKTYINSCSHGALSTDVRDAYQAYLNDRDQYGACWELWSDKLEILRKLVTNLINARPDEVAITSSVSDGLNSLATAIDFSRTRNKLVLTDFDFPTTAQIWRAQEQRGAQCVQVSASDDGKTLPFEHFEKAIDETTLIVSIPQICYRNGSKLDVMPIIELAHQCGALVFLDCYQSIGSIPVNVRSLDVDFAAGGMLKYLISSSGTGFLYVKQDLINDLIPTSSGWFSQENIHSMDIYHNDPANNARRFESGTPNIPNIFAAIAGLSLVQEVGVSEIERHVKTLTEAIMDKAKECSYQLAMQADENAHGALVTLKTKDMYKLVSLLTDDDIITSCRDDNLRISPHFYNNLDDIERLFECLEKYHSLMI